MSGRSFLTKTNTGSDTLYFCSTSAIMKLIPMVLNEDSNWAIRLSVLGWNKTDDLSCM